MTATANDTIRIVLSAEIAAILRATDGIDAQANAIARMVTREITDVRNEALDEAAALAEVWGDTRLASMIDGLTEVVA